MTSLESLRLDLEEANKLLEAAMRKRIKDILSIEVHKLQTEIKKLEEQAETAASHDATPTVKTKVSSRPVNKITTYAWDQSEKFMKLYITLNGVNKIPKEYINCEFTKTGFDLRVSDLDGKDHTLLITRLMEDIIAEESYFKVKTDMVLLMLKKVKSGKTWAYVTKKEEKEKAKEEKPMSDDPSQGMMEMLKKMYDEGDDEMKRSISKAWSDSQNKRSNELGGMM